MSLLETDERILNPFCESRDVRDGGGRQDLKTPMSAGYLYKKSFFQNFPNKNRFKLTRSESERKLPPVVDKTDSSFTGNHCQLTILLVMTGNIKF